MIKTPQKINNQISYKPIEILKILLTLFYRSKISICYPILSKYYLIEQKLAIK